MDFDDEEVAEPEQEEEDLREDIAQEITMPSRFDQVQSKGYIDVWWLYDDGGDVPCVSALVLSNNTVTS